MAIALVVLAMAIVAAAAAFGASTRGRMSTADPDVPPVALPEDRWTIGADLDRTRFGVGLRGYRMEQVDEVLDRVSRDLVQREEYVADLAAALTRAGVAVPERPAPIVSEQDLDDSGDEVDALDEAPAEVSASSDQG
ncbi:MAG: DivIVA domain-containing protein [Actinobacteria bacterium]|nr:DivIVA domain-containing protein [Actinomycetota bacterium]